MIKEVPTNRESTLIVIIKPSLIFSND